VRKTEKKAGLEHNQKLEGVGAPVTNMNIEKREEYKGKKEGNDQRSRFANLNAGRKSFEGRARVARTSNQLTPQLKGLKNIKKIASFVGEGEIVNC